MDDLEMCKRIAEIEGADFSVNGDHVFYKPDGWPCAYNPLTDDALCFQLMVKHDIDLISPYRPNGEVLWCADIFVNECSDGLSVLSVRDENPNKAICLAIIEANKGK